MDLYLWDWALYVNIIFNLVLKLKLDKEQFKKRILVSIKIRKSLCFKFNSFNILGTYSMWGGKLNRFSLLLSAARTLLAKTGPIQTQSSPINISPLFSHRLRLLSPISTYANAQENSQLNKSCNPQVTWSFPGTLQKPPISIYLQLYCGSY